MDHRRLLEAYMVHVCYQEGTPLVNPHQKVELMLDGLDEAEADEVIRIADIAYARFKREVA